MMKKNLGIILGLFLMTGAYAQDQAKKAVLTIDSKPVYLNEFEAVFKKNNDNPDTSPEGLDEYMDLFVKYKLKVAEAEALGMDTLTTFKRELEGYRRQLAAPYLTDEAALEELVKEAYEHLKYEVSASHILIRATGKDTAEAYNKIMDLKKKLQNGADFEQVAMEYSEDPSAANNKGYLGYFSGMQMVWPFEKAAFESELNEVAGPIRTNYGYHLIKIDERRPSRGTLKTSHILIKMGGDSVLAEQKAKELYEKLKAGADFAELAKKYSDDENSANQGGSLPEFGVGKMVEEFEKAAYQLEKPGDFSKPIKTRYGYHIIQLDEKIDIPPFKEIKPKILNRIKRDDRSDIARESFIKQMKDEYNYQRNEKALKDFYKWVDKSVFEGKWQIPSKARDKKIASWANTGITQKEFAEYIDSRQRKATPEDIQYFVDELFRQYEERRILEFENDRLEEKYPEFKALMQEYRDGILLFDLMNKMVWNKAIEDTTGLKRFFQENQDQFQWKERAKAVAFKSEDKNLLAKAMKKLKKGWTEAQVLEEFSDDEKLVLTSESIFAERGENELLDLFNWKTGVSDIKKHNDRYAALQITEIIEAGPKKLEEAKGAAIAAYQTYLENEWIKELKAKYTIKINKDVLYSLQ